MPRTSAHESGFWHTPNVPNGGRVNPPDMSPTGILANGKKRQVGLEHQARMVEMGFWPTPKAEPSGPDFARVHRPGSGGDDLVTAVAKMEVAIAGGSLNPEWLEWLMGYPIGWTAVEPLETR